MDRLGRDSHDIVDRGDVSHHLLLNNVKIAIKPRMSTEFFQGLTLALKGDIIIKVRIQQLAMRRVVLGGPTEQVILWIFLLLLLLL